MDIPSLEQIAQMYQQQPRFLQIFEPTVLVSLAAYWGIENVLSPTYGRLLRQIDAFETCKAYYNKDGTGLLKEKPTFFNAHKLSPIVDTYHHKQFKLSLERMFKPDQVDVKQT